MWYLRPSILFIIDLNFSFFICEIINLRSFFKCWSIGSICIRCFMYSIILPELPIHTFGRCLLISIFYFYFLNMVHTRHLGVLLLNNPTIAYFSTRFCFQNSSRTWSGARSPAGGSDRPCVWGGVYPDSAEFPQRAGCGLPATYYLLLMLLSLWLLLWLWWCWFVLLWSLMFAVLLILWWILLLRI